MTKREKTQLLALAKLWKKESSLLRRSAKKTWEDLEGGKQPQVDEIIYSVYEQSAVATELFLCARVLEELLGKLEKGGKK
jgi:hypothetical protein